MLRSKPRPAAASMKSSSDLANPHFGRAKAKSSHDLLTEPPHVLATGGGAFMDAETRARIHENAISVWLKANVDLLLERVRRKDNRPLLRNTDSRTALMRLIGEREPVYAHGRYCRGIR